MWTFFFRVPIAATIFVLAVALAGSETATAVAPAEPPAMVQGDADCNHTVAQADALAVLETVAGLAAAPCSAAADVQCDGKIDTRDALAIIEFAAGMTLPAADACTAIGEPVEVQPSPPLAADLIAAALEAGDIDFEESLVYRAYALFNDERLPEEYRSPAPDLGDGTLLFKEVEAHEGTLSAETMAELAPFMARPNDPISIFNQAQPSAVGAAAAPLGEWRSLSSLGGAYRLWTRGEPAAANAILEEFDVDLREIVAEEDKFIDGPIPDEPGIPSFDVNPDSAIDIYLFDGGGIDPRRENCDVNYQTDMRCIYGIVGETRDAAPFIGNKSSGYVLMDRNHQGGERTRVLAHELFHVSQNAYDYQEIGDRAWFIDSTAEWAGFQVLRQLGRDTTPVKIWLPVVFKNIDTNPLIDGSTEWRYRSWIYYYFLSLEEGDTQVVRDIWEAAAAPGQQLASAIDSVFPFEEYLPKFESYNWNQEPYDWYALDQQILDTAHLFLESPEEVSLEGSSQSQKFEMMSGVTWMTGRFFHFQFTDSAVRSGIFYNKLVDVEHAHVTALIKVKGQWKEEDWTDRDMVYFCRDKSSQKYEELVIILSNSDWQKQHPILDSDEDPYLEASAVGCPGWSGTVTAETYLNDAIFSITLNDVLFTHDPADTDPFDNVESYVLKSASPVVWHASGTWPNPNCAISGEMFLKQPPSLEDGYVYGGFQALRDTGTYSIFISGHSFEDDLLTVNCSGQAPQQWPWPVVHPITWDGGMHDNPLTEDGGNKVAEGVFDNPSPLSGGHWTWHLEEVK